MFWGDKSKLRGTDKYILKLIFKMTGYRYSRVTWNYCKPRPNATVNVQGQGWLLQELEQLEQGRREGYRDMLHDLLMLTCSWLNVRACIY